MKYIIMALPGAADYPSEELGGKRPLEVAKIPNLNFFAKAGKVGTAKLFSDRLEPSSDVSFLSLLGYDVSKIYTGQGPLEAANLDLELEENEVAFRMNFITEAGGRLADATAGRITTKEAKALINFLNKKIASEFVRFFAGAEYRHIAVLKDAHGYEALSARTVAPETIEGELIEANFPKGPGAELLKKMMFDTKLLLQDHEINQVRVDLKENPANMIWLWGQGPRPKIQKFLDLYGLSGAVIATMEYARGAARLAGLTVIDVPATTGTEGIDYERKARALLDALKEKDLVLVHLEAAEEASRRGDMKAKISALEAADFFVLSRVKEYWEHNKELRVLIASCHVTPWRLRRHVRDPAPFVVAGKNIVADDIEKFSEVAARNSVLKFQRPTELMEYLVRN